ncbi:DUF1499 domain-containing protein, partial [Lichenihabitans sp. Uapishka_5]|uniref:DUF1499 domain-containing protein n=1 Tax=Lichenihabitans sp. Uapishka_5 TaxID=3037302 RepID=UPI0029E7EBC8
LAAVTLAYPATLAATLARAPLSAAASTVPEAPPPLSRSARAVAARGVSPSETPAPVAAADPITLDMPAGDAFDTVEDAVKALRWRLVEAVPPGGRLGLGHIEAIAFSPVMHLPQDISIRVAPAAGQARVDVVSVARLGVTDFGEGAATIRQLGDAVAAQADD